MRQGESLSNENTEAKRGEPCLSAKEMRARTDGETESNMGKFAPDQPRQPTDSTRRENILR